MLSVDESVEEPWGDVPHWQSRAAPVRAPWLDRLLAVLALVAGAVGAARVVRLTESRDGKPKKETHRGGRA